MPTLEHLKTRIGTVDVLRSVVRTMKTLAAVSIRQHEKAIQTVADYSKTIEMGLQILFQSGAAEFMELQPAKGGMLGALVLGSDQGLCGRFNEQVATFAREQLRILEPTDQQRYCLCVGERPRSYLEGFGERVDGVIPAPVSVTGILPVVNAILLNIEQWQARHGVTRLVLCGNRLAFGTSCYPELLRLLPFDRAQLGNIAARPWPGTSIPLYTMNRERLFSLLIRHSLFALLFRALAESIAAENASRLASMQAAEKNIEERLDELQLLFRELRQGIITEELLDIVAGFEAMTSGHSR